MKAIPVAARAAALFACVLLTSAAAFADTRPDSHAPIGVMGDHIHAQGEFMLSYRYMHMSMEGNRRGSTRASPADIVTTEANRFFNPPMQPPTLRVVPTQMDMGMHMIGLMYAPTDQVTLMGMVNLIDKSMDHETYMGPAGANLLGTFTTESDGFGDTSVAALIKIFADSELKWHATLGLSLPTGDIEQTDDILSPMNTRPIPRLPYPMQLGSGTVDLIAGLTVSAERDNWGWGSQWRSVFRTGDNDESYRLGDEHRVSAWLSYLMGPRAAVSARIEAYERGNIDGIDVLIVAPVQTADPDRQAISRVDIGAGINYLFPGDQHRLSFEILAPVAQHLDGPQLETDWTATVGWQYAW